MSGKRIYIAGHTGMLGSAIVRALEAQGGYEIITEHHRSIFDLCEKEHVRTFFRVHAPDYVFMAAGAVGGIQANIDNPARFLADNARMAMNIIDACKEYGAKLCYVGSSCIYPRECPQPMKEEYLWTGTLEPTNKGYAIGKLVGVEYAQMVLGNNVLIPLPCNLYGTNDHYDEKGHVLASLVRRFVDAKGNHDDSVGVWGSGRARREFLHVDDCARILVELMDRGVKGVINVGSDSDVSIMQLVSMIISATEYQGAVLWDMNKPDGMPRKLLDSWRISALGLRPKITLEEGISRTVAEYRALKARA